MGSPQAIRSNHSRLDLATCDHTKRRGYQYEGAHSSAWKL